jgi:hypothetical protein
MQCCQVAIALLMVGARLQICAHQRQVPANGSAVRLDAMSSRHATDCLHTGHLRDGGAVLGGRVQVNVVGADARRQDQLQFGCLLEQLLCTVAGGTTRFGMVLISCAASNMSCAWRLGRSQHTQPAFRTAHWSRRRGGKAAAVSHMVVR